MKSKPTTPPSAADGPEVRFRNLLPGDPPVFFRQRAANNPTFNFDTVAGRYVLLAFIGSTHQGSGAQSVKALDRLKDVIDGDRIVSFAVSVDPRDEESNAIEVDLPRLNVFWDFDLSVSRAYGAASADPAPNGEEPYRPLWYLLDPQLRMLSAFPPPADEAALNKLRDLLKGLPPAELHAGVPMHAPALFVPRVFEPNLCQALIDYYRRVGGEESGFMRDVGGKTTLILDPNHKRRRDANITDEKLMNAARERVRRRIVPEIKKAYQFDVTRIERDIVACYRAEDSGHFRAHRDNTTLGTAHRRFAVTINLNDDWEGGTLSFPEYGALQYKPPAGSAVVFSCNLLHKVVPITRGERFAYLPFLYDDAAAKIREANAGYLDDAVGGYRDGKSGPDERAKPSKSKEKAKAPAPKSGPMAFEDDEPVI